MCAMASQITGVSIVCQAFVQAQIKGNIKAAPLAFVGGIHRWLMKLPHKGLVTRKMFPFSDVIMDYLGGYVKQNAQNVYRKIFSFSPSNVFYFSIPTNLEQRLEYPFIID